MVARTAHGAQDVGGGVLERDIEVGKHAASRHQRHDLVYMGVGVDVMQPHPGAELAQLAGEVDEFGPHLAVPEGARCVAQVEAIGTGILRNDEKLFDASIYQPLGLT